MRSPSPSSSFRRLYSLTGVALLAAAVACWWTPAPRWVLGLAFALGLLGLVRVPRRLRQLEMAVAFAVLFSFGGHWVLLLVTAGAAGVCLLAPEAGLARAAGLERRLYTLTGLALLTATALCWWTPAPWWALAVCFAVGVHGVTNAPLRVRQLQLALGFVVLACSGGVWVLLVFALGAVALIRLDLEAGLARLNGMDRFCLVQEYPGMAFNSHYVLDTDRRLKARPLEAALDSLMVEVPLLRSFVREVNLSAERFVTASPWKRARDLIRVSDAPDADERGALDVPFDLERDPPLRILITSRSEGGWRTVFTVHHSICDGTAHVVLFDALMQRYQELLCGAPPRPAPHLTRRLPRMRDLLRDRGPLWMWTMIRKHVHPMAKVGVLNASVLEDEQARPEATHRHRIVLERDGMDALWTAAKAYRATRNHLYLAASLKAAESWRAARSRPARPYRVLTPIDLRPLLGEKPGLGNYSGIINLDFTPQDVAGDALLAQIKEQLRAGRQLEQAIEAPTNLGVVSALLPIRQFRKGLREFDADPKSFFFSYGFTAINFPPRLHLPSDVDVRRVWMTGSVTGHPGFGVGPVRDRGRVYLMCVHRAPLLSVDGAKDYLRRFKEELERLVADAPERRRRRPRSSGSAAASQLDPPTSGQ